MRPTSLAFPLLALAALGLVLAPAVTADGADEASEGKGKAVAAEKRAERAERGEDAPRGHGGASGNDAARADVAARADANDASEALDRPAHVTAFWERMKEIRASWQENATKVREDCRAQTLDRENASRDAWRAQAHCIRDGYRDIRAWHKAEIGAARDEFKAARDAWVAHKKADS